MYVLIFSIRLASAENQQSQVNSVRLWEKDFNSNVYIYIITVKLKAASIYETYSAFIYSTDRNVVHY